jgi:hypothetical protein
MRRHHARVEAAENLNVQREFDEPTTDEPTVDELTAWLRESRAYLEHLTERRKRYLRMDESERVAYAREWGFLNLTDLTSSIGTCKRSVERFERALEQRRCL